MAMPRYYIPRDLEQAIKESNNATSPEGVNMRNKFFHVLQKLKNLDCLEIAECHYLQFLKLGLYLEEHQQRIDMIKQFEIEKSTIEKVPDSEGKFKINVEKLDESNPFLNISDYMVAYEQNKPNTKFFFTIVKVCTGHVIVAGNKKFCKLYREVAKYTIILKFNTYWFQCCHYALTAVDPLMISDYIFPEKRPAISEDLNCHQTWFNKDVFNNPEQNQAVCNIINKSSFPAPYILYGPPGTGKTSTLVEAICQSWHQSDDYILICAPSNAACDVVTKRLLDYISFSHLYRMYSRTEEYSRIDEDIKKCCNFKDGKVDEIEKVDLSCKKIIITTLCTSVRLERLKRPFSHVFIDEGGQASQAEALLPFCALKSSQNFQIVISGDHQQLGPLVRSKFAEPILEQSILEKLMKRNPYKKDAKTGYDPRYITKLIHNYRSTKDIIHVSNVLFYDNELIACNKANVSTFPIAFYAVEGKELKTSNSTSSYNDEEINIVLMLVKSILGKKAGDKIIRREDIGIVTPFKLQVSKLREKLDDSGLKEVSVGTVEVYQGQEKEVIIISTVRTKTFEHDGVKHIGFLSNPKRFNVALTRAKSLLAVVGNPQALQTNKYWRYFLRFCQQNNACLGASFILNDETPLSLQELYTECKSKKSTDLFPRKLQILKIDDGVLNTSKSNHNNSKDTSTSTTDTPLSNANSIRITPDPVDIMKASMSNINAETTSDVPTNSVRIYNSSMKNLNSIRNSSVTTSHTITDHMNSINSVPNTAVTRDIRKATISTINEVPNSAVPASSINNPSMKNRNTIRTSPMATSRNMNASMNSINSVPNTAVTRGNTKAPMSNINARTNSAVPTNFSTRNLYSIQNSPMAASGTMNASINSINTVPNTVKRGIMNAPMSNINARTNSAVPKNSTNFSTRNLYSIQNSPMAASGAMNASINSINSIPNTVTRGIMKAPMNNINAERNSATIRVDPWTARSTISSEIHFRKPTKLKKKKGCFQCCIL